MNYMKALLDGRSRSLLTVSNKIISTRGIGDFRHLPDKHVFLLKLPEGNAEVKYIKENGTLNLHETNVPENYQGKGIGKIIAKNVLEYCLERDIKVKLTCEFLIKFCETNKQFNNIIIPSN